MRLTLRTMLAYLDDILEPDDAQDIGKKIEESEYATSLMHRIRDVMRRLRLAAPSVTERGPGLDSNTVAEYLDNTLASERVPDFEKVCLESDIHLAEVAACHQVLAAVLGEPVEIDPESRQRMYQLPQLAAQAAADRRGDVAPAASGDGKGPADLAAQGARPKSLVPEYLREPPKKRRLLTAVTLLVLAGCFTGAVLGVLGQFQPGSPLGNLLRTGHWGGGLAAAPESTKAGQEPEKQGSPAAPATGTVSAGGTSKTVKPPAALTATGSSPATVAGGSGAQSPERAAKPGPAPTPAPSPTAIAKIDTKQPPGPATPPAANPPPNVPGGKAPAAAVPPAGTEPGKPAPEKIEAPVRLGRFASGDDQVLLTYNPQAGYWERVGGRDVLASRQRLLALPTYRDQIILDTGATLEVLGGTQLQLLPGAEKTPPGAAIDCGRLVLTPVQAEAQVQLAAGGHHGVLTLVDAETIAALDVVVRFATPGVNPEHEAPPATADLYVTHGAVLWQENGAAKPLRIVAPARLTLDEQSPHSVQPMESKDLPKWIVLEPLGLLEQRASAVVAQSLLGGRSAGLGLMELAYHRQKEVAWLARRCLGYIGQFDPLVAALNDPLYKPAWADYVEQLRQGVARGPETAAAVRQALEKQYDPDEAPQLYRMLWGYTDKQLQNGADAKLVEMLEHKTLAVRVLAFWNLKDITGLGLFYRPEQTAAKNRQFVTQWKKRREAGEIRIKSTEARPAPAAVPPPPPPALDQ